MGRRYFIVVGDTTTGGGAVLTGAPFLKIQSLSGDLRQQAFVGDHVQCDECGPTRIVSGVSHATFNGCQAAVDGSDLACGHSLVSTQQRLSWVEDASAAAIDERPAMTLPQSFAEPARSAKPARSVALGGYDEAFILTSRETGRPLANRKYRIIRGDVVEPGITDTHGATHVVASDTGESLEIFLQEEGP